MLYRGEGKTILGNFLSGMETVSDQFGIEPTAQPWKLP